MPSDIFESFSTCKRRLVLKEAVLHALIWWWVNQWTINGHPSSPNKRRYTLAAASAFRYRLEKMSSRKAKKKIKNIEKHTISSNRYVNTVQQWHSILHMYVVHTQKNSVRGQIWNTLANKSHAYVHTYIQGATTTYIHMCMHIII